MKAVVAFGGNAIARADQAGTFDEQQANIQVMCQSLVTLVERGVQVVITHGNGPQVGRIAIQQDLARNHGVPAMPFDAAGAMSEGLIGYMLQQSLGNELRRRGLDTPCATIVTQVVVSGDDSAFSNPTKPVGNFYSAQEAEALAAAQGWTMVEDAGRGYRRVVPSPKPLAIVEWPAISQLLDAGVMVIAAGGGGIPVIQETDGSHSTLRGIEAVIDKDRASARLAAMVNANVLVLLTDVDQVAVSYGMPDERWLGSVGVSEMRGFLASGEFPPGSMGPKVESAVAFVDEGGERSVITSSRSLVDAVLGDSGTQILRDAPAS